MRIFMIASLMAAMAATPAAAMDVATFLLKANALKSKGAMALLSSDYKPVMAELDVSGKALRAERLAVEAAGGRPAYCPAGHSPLSPFDIFSGLQAVPPAQQAQVQVKDALRALYSKKYPCAAALRSTEIERL
jgi:hypothetical protein